MTHARQAAEKITRGHPDNETICFIQEAIDAATREKDAQLHDLETVILCMKLQITAVECERDNARSVAQNYKALEVQRDEAREAAREFYDYVHGRRRAADFERCPWLKEATE